LVLILILATISPGYAKVEDYNKLIDSMTTDNILSVQQELQNRLMHDKSIDSNAYLEISRKYNEKFKTINEQYQKQNEMKDAGEYKAIDQEKLKQVIGKYQDNSFFLQDISPSLRIDEVAKYEQELRKYTLSEVVDQLLGGKIEPNKLPSALGNVSSRIMRAGNFEQAMEISDLASEKYFDRFSLYKLMRIYRFGTKSLKEAQPNMIINKEITPSNNRAAYYAMTLIMLETVDSTGILDPSNQIGWNTIATMDELQKIMNEKDLNAEKILAKKLIEKKYPKVNDLNF